MAEIALLRNAVFSVFEIQHEIYLIASLLFQMQDNSLSKQFFYLNKTFPELNHVEKVHTGDSQLEMTYSLAQGSSGLTGALGLFISKASPCTGTSLLQHCCLPHLCISSLTDLWGLNSSFTELP